MNSPLSCIRQYFLKGLCLVLVLGCGCADAPKRDMDRVSLRLKWIHQAQFAGFYVAEKEGHFDRAGIKVTIRPGGQDQSALKLVANGSDDFGVWGADQLIIARSRGIPVVALAVIFPRSPVCFTALADSGIEGPEDFVGRRIGMQYGTNVETEYVAMLRRVGVDRKLIDEVPVQFNFQLLLEGQVDAWPSYAINEPIRAKELGFEVNIISPHDYGVKMYADTLFTTEEMITEKPELVRAFVDAVLKGWRSALDNKELAIQDLMAYSPEADVDHELAALKAAEPLIQPTRRWQIGSMKTETWEEMVVLLEDQGLLDGKVAAESVFTNEFLPPN